MNPLPWLLVGQPIQLVHLYAERGSPKYERAARRLVRYLTEGTPRLQHFAEITTSLAKLEHDRRSPARIEERELVEILGRPTLSSTQSRRLWRAFFGG